jgi:hypothetical protein
MTRLYSSKSEEGWDKVEMTAFGRLVVDGITLDIHAPFTFAILE